MAAWGSKRSFNVHFDTVVSLEVKGLWLPLHQAVVAFNKYPEKEDSMMSEQQRFC
jgi:hypothetical protein